MAVPVVFLMVFLLVATGLAQLEHSKNISLGSSLFPKTEPTRWLSPSGLFSFGFYPQGSGFAVGIRLADNTVVWTAHRDDPPLSPNSTIEFTQDGKLLLCTSQDDAKPIAGVNERATSAFMLDSGSFVIYGKSSVIWDSFHYPTDTILGGQSLLSGSYSDKVNSLVSSVAPSNHSSGRFHLNMQSDGNLVAYPALSSQRPEDAYWDTSTFGGTDLYLHLNLKGDLYINASHSNHTLANSSYSGNYKMIIYRATLDPDGNFRLYSHDFRVAGNSTMVTQWSALANICDVKGFCGVNSFCIRNATSAACSCFPGFVFVNPNNMVLGCYNKLTNEEGCRVGKQTPYTITPLYHMFLGGYNYSVISAPFYMEEDCVRSCLEDCYCWGALYTNTTGSGTCNKQKLPLYGVQDQVKPSTAFIKMITFQTHPIPSPLSPQEKIVSVRSKKTLVLSLVASLGFVAFICSLISVSSFFLYRCRARRYQKLSENAVMGRNGEFILRSFSYIELEKATDGFKEVLGKNSFGTVYKGTISICEDEKVVAVKRLERVGGGERGFQAEMTAIGKTHHRNLVRSLGFCIEGTRKLLVYEFMRNGSLADLLFKVDSRPNWQTRVRIALEVAKGIFYLHEECEARIIHCNIKPQNILMDESWTAKISDFGLAKHLMPNQTGTLSGVRGTGGYLAPEWHKNAPISEKVDVYSFGVVLLEILCCRSNMELNVSTADEILLSTWVYNCYLSKELKKLIGDEEVDTKTVERIVKVGLLCIQYEPNLRPSMKNVILMLEGTMDIPVPQSPSLL